MAYRANDPQHVEDRTDAAEREAKEVARAFRETLRTFEGRRTLWEVLTWCGTFQSILAADALGMAFRAGQQDLGHKLIAQLTAADAGLYDQMAREARARAKQAALLEAVNTQQDEGITHDDQV